MKKPQLLLVTLLGLASLTTIGLSQRPGGGGGGAGRPSGGGGGGGGISRPSGGGGGGWGGSQGGGGSISRPSGGSSIGPTSRPSAAPTSSRPSYSPPVSSPTRSAGADSGSRGYSAPPVSRPSSDSRGSPTTWTGPVPSVRTDSAGRSSRSDFPTGASSSEPGPSQLRRAAPSDIATDSGLDSSGEGNIDIPTIGTNRRVPFPKLTSPADQSGSRTSRTSRSAPAPTSDTGPSSVRRSASSGTPQVSRPAPRPGIGEVVPQREVGQKQILERYARPSSGSTTDQATRKGITGPSSKRIDARTRTASDATRTTTPRSDVAKRSANAREKQQAQSRADRVQNARKSYAQDTRSLRDLALDNPKRARNFEQAGQVIANYTNAGLGIGVAATAGCMTGGWNNPCYWNGWYGCGSYNWCWWWNGCWPYSSWCWWSYPWNWCGWWGWNSYCNWGWGASWGGYWPTYYSVPVYYSVAIADSYDDTNYVQAEAAPEQYSQPAQQPSDEALGQRAPSSDKDLLDSLLLPSSKGGLARASEQYLVLGDNAFKDRRYSDAVHFYAKAVEFSPEDGMLYLILSDALFATGDYHYAAYALRKALELDPSLANVSVDKHDFYVNDPGQFDRQLAVLESYLQDQPADNDAILVLAANFLFGGRPQAAVALLDRPQAARVREEAAGRLIYEAAKIAQDGAAPQPEKK